jgi:hypothetical protein
VALAITFDLADLRGYAYYSGTRFAIYALGHADALVRGGVFALAGLLGVLIWGLYRAWWLAQQGEEIWIMLVSFGVSGLIFDGDSAFSMLSIPRFETLILWVPLVMASVRYMVLNHAQVAPACVEVSPSH